MTRRSGRSRAARAPRQEGALLRWTRRGIQVLMPVLCVGAVLVVVPTAHADGPGYGGGADKLTVEWVDAGSGGSARAVTGSTGGVRAGVAAGQPAVAVDDAALLVVGVGFRGSSAISVRVGSDDSFGARADATGTLDVDVPVPLAQDAGTGTSVVATGRSPAGTSMTLVGAIPPRPTGRTPGDLVPWLGAAVLLGLAGSWLVARLRPRPVPVGTRITVPAADAPQPTQAPQPAAAPTTVASAPFAAVSAAPPAAVSAGPPVRRRRRRSGPGGRHA